MDCDQDFLVDLGSVERAKELVMNYELFSVKGIDDETVTYCFKTKDLLNEWLSEKKEIDGNTVEAVKRDYEHAKKGDFKNMKKLVIQINLFNAKWGLEMMGSHMQVLSWSWWGPWGWGHQLASPHLTKSGLLSPTFFSNLSAHKFCLDISCSSCCTH